MDLDPVRMRVLKLIKQRDTDMKHASLALGRNAAYLHQFVFRGTPKVLPEDLRAALAKFLDVDESELRHRTVPQRKPRSADSSQDEFAPPSKTQRLPAGFSAVAEIDVRASAGPGAIHDGLEEAKETWLFPDLVLRHEFRAQPADLRMITIDGDSMEPLLASGDRILIDTSQRMPVPPGIFVIWDGLGLVAKRVEHVPNSDPSKIVIRSINPAYQSYDRDAEEVNIVGRVVWAAKRI